MPLSNYSTIWLPQLHFQSLSIRAEQKKKKKRHLDRKVEFFYTLGIAVTPTKRVYFNKHLRYKLRSWVLSTRLHLIKTTSQNVRKGNIAETKQNHWFECDLTKRTFKQIYLLPARVHTVYSKQGSDAMWMQSRFLSECNQTRERLTQGLKKINKIK